MSAEKKITRDPSDVARRLESSLSRRTGDFKPLDVEGMRAWLAKLRGSRPPAPEPEYRCARCQDRGWDYFKDAAGHQWARRCGCVQAPTREAFDLPDVLRGVRLSDCRRDLANAHGYEAVEEWIADLAAVNGRRADGSAARLHMLAEGGVGTGKTTLFAAGLNEAVERGLSGVFCSVPWLIALQLRGIADEDKRAEAQALYDRALDSDVLVLDDLGSGEKPSDYTRGLLLMLLERRYHAYRRTLITSNLSLQKIAEFYGDARIPSRIAGACGETIELAGGDRRLRRTAADRKGFKVV